MFTYKVYLEQNKGNFNRSKRTKKLNFKEFLVDF